MKRKTVSGIMLSLLLIGMLILTFNIQPARSDWTWTETIYIRADGSVDPPTANITTVDNITYTLTDNIVGANPPDHVGAIVVERDNIVVDGAGYTLQGIGYGTRGTGIDLSGRSNVTIQNTEIKEFRHWYGVWLNYSSKCNIYGNSITNNHRGIGIIRSSKNTVYGNNITNMGFGICLEYSPNNNIYGNNIISHYEGISLLVSSWNVISENNIEGNTLGIRLIYGNYYNTISGNNIKNNLHGIDVYVSPRTTISGNNITASTYDGIWLKGSSSNIISGNNLTNNHEGILLSSSSYNTISGNNFKGDGLLVRDSYQNIVEDNVVNGKPLVYLEDASDVTVESAGQVILVDCSNVRVENLDLSNTTVGVELLGTDNTRIMQNNITNNRHGILLYESSINAISGNNITKNNGYGILLGDSSNNTISGNHITENYRIGYTSSGVCLSNSSNNDIYGNNITNNQDGILLYYPSNYNTISGNNITNNGGRGIYLDYSSNNVLSGNSIASNDVGIRLSGWGSSDNTISGNSITNNRHGIWLDRSSNNTICHNNFVDNTEQVRSYDSTNVWDDGYASGGNYWSDYTGVDLYSGPYQNVTGSDGIGDTRYIINGTNQDRYPLMRPFTEFMVTLEGVTYHVNMVSNSTLSDFYFSKPNKLITFNVTGPADTVGFCRVTIPKDLLRVEDGQWIALIDGMPVPYMVIEDTVDTYIYLTYVHSTHEVRIIGTHVGPPRLTIYSSPTGVTFTVDDVSSSTPWSGTYSVGSSVSLVMPEIHTVGDVRYSWDQWSDGITSRSRTVTMDTDITLTAQYAILDYQLTVTSSPLTEIPFTINGVPQTTPYTEWLLEGSYTLEMPQTHNGYEWSHWLEDGDTNRIKTILLQGTTWTAVYVLKPVGGKATPINIPMNKPETPALWIWLTTSILSMVLAVVYVKKRKRNTEINC